MSHTHEQPTESIHYTTAEYSAMPTENMAQAIINLVSAGASLSIHKVADAIIIVASDGRLTAHDNIQLEAPYQVMLSAVQSLSTKFL